MFSLEVRKRFVSDMKLSFPVLEDPYFDYYIELYDEMYNTSERLELLKNDISKFKSQEEFLKAYYEVRNNMIEALNNEAFKKFNTMDMNDFSLGKVNYPKKDVFNVSNVGKIFVSIDLVKANFQALKYVDKDIVLGANTYEELVSNFTDMDYIKKSKYIRQVIFGNLNPKRTVTVERYLIQKVLNLLLYTKDVIEKEIKMVSNDEIVYEITNDLDIEKISNLRTIIKEITDIDVDIEVYILKQIGNVKPFFIKEFLNKEGNEIMCVPQDFKPQVLKYLMGKETNEYDRSFINQGMIASYKDDIELIKYRTGDKVEITNLEGLEDTNLKIGDKGTYIARCVGDSSEKYENELKKKVHLIAFKKDIRIRGSLITRSQVITSKDNFKLDNENIY